MKPLDLQAVTQYVEEHIAEFHKKRLDKIIEPILDAYISSSEETVFGNWLERLAIFINELVYGGQKAQ